MGRGLIALAGAAAAILAACGPAVQPAGAGATAGGAAPALPPGGYAALEAEVLTELNATRRDPAAYARRLEALIPHFDGLVLRRPGAGVGITTREGAAAVREAAAALRRTAPLPPVHHSRGMSAGAREHVADQGPRGALSHTGTDGSNFGDRVNRHGRWLGHITESIAFGPATGEEVVQGLIIDDAVPDRGHRRNLLDPRVRVAGIACGPHARYRVMCVIDLAAAYEER